MADKTVKVINQSGPTGFVLFIAWIGALVYFAQRAEGFGEFLLAFLKSLVWPAFVLHRAMELLAL